MPIYADFNATSPISAQARAWMEKAMDAWGNPSSSHTMGRKANEIMQESRSALAEKALCKDTELVFTSGGSEANTLALMGCYFTLGNAFKLLTTKVEHSSIKDTAVLLKNLGAQIEYIPIRNNGSIDLEAFKILLDNFKPNLVSVMTANNETGIVFPIPEIAKLCHAAGTYLHTDAVQAFGKMDSQFWKDADLISISAHKIHGPKGVGALIIKNGVKLVATHYGGAQEIKRRGGTENVIGIAGFGGAATELSAIIDTDKLKEVRDKFESEILKGIDGVAIQGIDCQRLPNTTNIRFKGLAAEVLLTILDLEKVYLSAGSACSSGSISPSHVLLEMGMSKEEARECLRVSFGKTSTLDDATEVARLLVTNVKRIRLRRGNL